MDVRARRGPFDVSAVTPLLRHVVQTKLRLFHHFRDLDEDDLLQVALGSAAKAHETYDVTKGAATKSHRYHHELRADGLDRRYASWIGREVSCDLIDLYRKRKRQADREARVAVARDSAARVAAWHDAGEEAGLPGGLGDGDDDLPHEWLGRVYRYAVHAFTTPDPGLRYRRCPRGPWEAKGRPRAGGGRRGRKWYTHAQCVCATLYMRRYRLTTREAAERFAGDPDLMRAMQLKRVPAFCWFARARRRAELLGIPADTSDGPTGG